MTPTDHIDQIIRNWFWQPFASPHEAAKDILKLFGKRRTEHLVNRIAALIQFDTAPWSNAGSVLEIVNIGENKRRKV